MAARIVKNEDTIAVRCPKVAKELISHNPIQLIMVPEKRQKNIAGTTGIAMNFY